MRIIDIIAFNSIMNEMKMKRPNIPSIEHITTRTYCSKDLGALATSDFSTIGHEDVGGLNTRGNVVIKRVQDVKMLENTRDLQEKVAYLHDVALNKEKIRENLQEKYRHVYSTYEIRTKETIDL